MALASLALCALVALGASRAGAAIDVFVPCTAPGGGTNGLRAAIQDANNQGGGTITLARDCTFTIPDGAFDNGHGPVGLPVIESDITINGRDATIERAQGAFPAFRLLEVSDDATAALTLNEAKLQQGVAGQTGPAIPGGGAVLVTRPGTLTVTDSVFARNKSANGGAISSAGATVRISDSTFRNNRGLEDPGATGGAIINDGGRLIVNNSLLTDNQSTAKGGAIHSPAGVVKVTNSTSRTTGSL
jgi:predicted outer membrane repeat protein